jgi:sucrose-6-phosphatase
MTPSILLIASDLDQTLIGDNEALRCFRERIEMVRDSVRLVYVTGRSWELCPDLCTGTDPLPQPDYWITAIGTGIYRHGLPEKAWEQEMEHGWNRERLVELAATFPEIKPHPEPRLLTPHRIIYYLDPSCAEAVIAELRRAAEHEQIHAQFIFSHGIELDIVPRAGNKGNALSWLLQQLGITAAQSVACGDSGNDINLLQAAGQSIIVANARPELLAWHNASPAVSRFVAKRSHAAGVLEGLEHFGVLQPA